MSERRADRNIAERIADFSNQLQWNLPHTVPIQMPTVPPWQLPPVKISYLSNHAKPTLTGNEARQLFCELKACNPKSLYIFTDGSKVDNRTGNAVYISGYKIQCRLPDSTSVFVAELHALYVALKTVRQSRVTNIVICSDSKSALQSIVTPPFSHHLQVHICNVYNELYNAGFRVNFLWIPSHCGIEGNELADYYAKQSLELEVITDIPQNFDSIKSAIRRKVMCHWQSVWQADSSLTQLRSIKSSVKPWHSSLRKNRREEKILCRLRIGHTFITHAHIFSQSPRPRCDDCDEIVTVPHLLLHCSKYRVQRQKLQRYCTSNAIDFTLAVLLGDDNPTLLDLLFVFLRDTNLYDTI